MNFVTFDIVTGQTQSPLHLTQLFVLFKIRGHIQEPKTLRDTSDVLDSMEIRHLRPEHLITTTDTDHLASVTQMTINRLIPAVVPQPLQVATDVFTAGQNNQVCRGLVTVGTHILQVDLRVQTQGIKIGVITDTREHRYHYSKLGHLSVQYLLRGNRILGI